MTTLTEGSRTAEFIQSEANGYRSRDTVKVVTTPALAAGQVLGKVTSGSATATPQAGNTGNATSSAVTTGVNVKPGDYEVEFIGATEFIVTNPDGAVLGNGATGAEFDTGDEVVFTITVGGSAMVAGDGFTITVDAGSDKYTAYDAAAVDGSGVVAGVLYAGVDASFDGDAVVVIRDAEVKHNAITYTGTKASVVAGLQALGIIARD